MNSPIFLMRGEEIVDVFYGEFDNFANPVGGQLQVGPSTGFGDRVIVEGPDGCWEARVPVYTGNTLSFVSRSGTDGSFTKCRRISAEAEVAYEPVVQ